MLKALGALWYILAIERETTCWKKACANHIECVNGSFYCNDSLGNHTFINDSCPISTPNTKLFDFGIFLDALQSGVLEVRGGEDVLANVGLKYKRQGVISFQLHQFVSGKICAQVPVFGRTVLHYLLPSPQYAVMHSLSFRNLCQCILLMFCYPKPCIIHSEAKCEFGLSKSFGVDSKKHGLFFLMAIIIQNLLNCFLFVKQIYLQSKTLKLEELRLRNREIEQWKSFKKLPYKLQRQIKQYQRYKWQESRGVDVENLLKNFPKEIIMNIKSELFLKRLTKSFNYGKVKRFNFLGDRALNELCYYAKPVLFIKRSYITKEGDPIDKMLFIVQGKLRTYSSSNKTSESDDTAYLQDGDFCGEELLEEWHPFQSRHFPISKRNIQALTKVEAFSLSADDWKNLCIWEVRKLQFFRRNHRRRREYDHLLDIKIAGGVDNISASGNTSIDASSPDNSALETMQLINSRLSAGSPRPEPLAIREEEEQ
ncbi:cyclic nucleotide-gated ion channel 1-like [Durio zibethinus]|uniref:Cyclic nucleotide-gated ion channel 1-like n=1 Tax=Durio zibethinus TaxID=66656 RepID=A0A6P5WES7_DURZI|nr:cyclic nucleotide-gated ion channel 1-like [Durio zibethinus]